MICLGMGRASGGWDVFIAYPSAERAAAAEVYDALVAGGARV
jgi:hypothetical protein